MRQTTFLVQNISKGAGVCTENLIRVDDVMESPKLAERSGCSVSLWPSWPRHSSRSCGSGVVGVCTENLNPNVVVMKSAQDGVRTYDAGSLDRTRDRRILVQRPMRSNAVVIGRIVFQNAAQMHLVQYNDVVQTFPPDRSDQPFGKA